MVHVIVKHTFDDHFQFIIMHIIIVGYKLILVYMISLYLFYDKLLYIFHKVDCKITAWLKGFF